jgi:hypothetical protein
VKRRVLGLAGLAVALAAGGRLLTLRASTTGPHHRTGNAAPALRDRWPAARVVDTPARLPDGSAYTPWIYLDADLSVGTASSDDGAVRLLVRGADAAPRELLRRPAVDDPRFNAFAVAGDDLFWLVSAGDADADASSTLYRADWRRASPGTVVTADTGDVMFFNSQYDLVVADGRVRWAAARPGQRTTEMRSVPVTAGGLPGGGGPVEVRPLDGAYALSAWPWLTSAGSSQSGPVELRNLSTGQRQSVSAAPDELVTCGATWCRVLVLGAAGTPERTDLMRPDGTGRIQLATGDTTAAVLDVALLDRFEVLSVAGGTGDATGAVTLLLFDIAAGSAVVLATGVATTQARGPIVWWSTGDNETMTWHALDLRTLS